MIKLIAVDMDDTILNNRLQLTDYTKSVVKAAMERDIHVTFATGRMYPSCRPFAEQLDLDLPLITYNGAMIKQAKSENLLFHQPVPLSVAREIVAWTEQTGHYLQVYVNDKVFVQTYNDKAALYSNHAKVEVHAVGDLNTFLTEAPTKMLLMAEQNNIVHVQQQMDQLFGDAINTARSKPTYLEILHPEVSKGAALAHLACLLGVRREEVMAVGDGYNDIEMLDYAGVSVAMGNAHPYVKERADFVTATNEEDGAAKAIERFVFACK